MEIIFESKALDMYYHPQKNLVEVTWKGPTKGEVIKRAGDELLNLASLRTIDRWLINQKSMMVFPKDFEWLIQKYLPQIQQKLSKNTKVSIVLASNLFGEYSIKKMLNGHFPEGNPSIFYFYELESAWAWVSECNIALD